MGKKVCIDTDILINALKDPAYYARIRHQFSGYEAYSTTITVFELYKRKTNIDKVHFIMSQLQVLEFDTACAVTAANIFKNITAKGINMDYRDLFIAAIALAHECVLLTNNFKDFKNVPNLRLENVKD
ncbi:type II toxin-antitoxin system VapC family toxin [Candidatus Woesearchaeota archaeon]|nr:type II toxin-antitoxin system VapC family toxin [Candidatus Woesearchaeota archaeon]